MQVAHSGGDIKKQEERFRETKRKGKSLGKNKQKGKEKHIWGSPKSRRDKGKRMEGWTKSPREGISRNIKREREREKKKDN